MFERLQREEGLGGGRRPPAVLSGEPADSSGAARSPGRRDGRAPFGTPLPSAVYAAADGLFDLVTSLAGRPRKEKGHQSTSQSTRLTEKGKAAAHRRTR